MRKYVAVFIILGKGEDRSNPLPLKEAREWIADRQKTYANVLQRTRWQAYLETESRPDLAKPPKTR